MTVFYTKDVTNGENPLVCLKLLKRWKGSLYKLVWLDLVIFLAVYYGFNLLYRFVLNETQKRAFECVVNYCQIAHKDIPLWFLLGFFVSRIISRWFFSHTCIPWLNKTAFTIAAHLDADNNEETRKIRLAMMRYVNLSWILLMRLISEQTADRFPEKRAHCENYSKVTSLWWRPHKHRSNRTLQHPWIIERLDEEPEGTEASSGLYGVFKLSASSSHGSNSAMSPGYSTMKNFPNYSPFQESSTTEFDFTHGGYRGFDDQVLANTLRGFNEDKQVKATFGLLITEHEIMAFQNVAEEFYGRNKAKYSPEYWIPLQWAQRLVLKALSAGCIKDPRRANEIMKVLMNFRDKMQFLQLFSTLIIPLAYSQVVTIAVYSYFLCQLFADQFTQAGSRHLGSRDLYIPVVSICSFLFFMGWYKVALCVINPFGGDDEDFNVDAILDHNLDVSYRTVFMSPESFPTPLALNTTSSDAEEQRLILDKFLEQVHEEAMDNIATDPDTYLHANLYGM